MSRKTLALIAGLTVLTLILVVLALNTGQKGMNKNGTGTTATVQPTPTVPAHTVLSLSPNPVPVTANVATVDVMIDAEDNPVTGAQFEIKYDPDVLNFTEVKQGSFFGSALILINDVNRTEGRVTYALGLTPAQIQNPKTGKGTVATLTFTKRSNAPVAGNSALKIENALISAKDIGPSVLKSATGTTINLTNTASDSGR